ncbi:MAG: Methyltransferase type 11 [uncultured bacterium]|nr:MAG: Methyltransferase type 11 [uncultured bacterium]
MEISLCKICNSKKNKLFNKNILSKYDVAYFRCSDCGFIQTESPYWLEESYSSAITSLDIGLVNRNIQYSDIVENILYKYFDKNARFLDFAGGYGMFTRIMRDKGFDFYHEDKHCDNLFAKHFEINDLKEEDRKFEIVTAFELMEHIENPFKELDYIFSMTNSFLFSTELVPDENIENWWYLGVEHGQHISFYTKKCLNQIAKKYNKSYYTNGYLHLITDKKDLDIFQKKNKTEKIWSKLFKEKNSLDSKLPTRLQDDFEFVKNKCFYEK